MSLPDFKLGYDPSEQRLYIDDSADEDVLPTLAWMDDNAETETNHAQAAQLVAAVNAAPRMLTALINLLAPGRISAGVIEDGRDLLAELGHDVRKMEGHW